MENYQLQPNEREIFDVESQNKMILDYLMKGNRLTNLQGLKLFDALACRSRIANLRAKGHNIVTEMIKLANGKRVAEYRIVAPIKHYGLDIDGSCIDEALNLDSSEMNKPVLNIKANDLTVQHNEPNYCKTDVTCRLFVNYEQKT